MIEITDGTERCCKLKGVQTGLMTRVVLAIALIGVSLSPMCACFSSVPAAASECCAAENGGVDTLAAPSCCHVDSLPQPVLAFTATQTHTPSLLVVNTLLALDGAISSTRPPVAEGIPIAPSPPSAISVLRI